MALVCYGGFRFHSTAPSMLFLKGSVERSRTKLRSSTQGYRSILKNSF